MSSHTPNSQPPSEPDYDWFHNSDSSERFSISEVPQLTKNVLEGVGIIAVASAKLSANGLRSAITSVRHAKNSFDDNLPETVGQGLHISKKLGLLAVGAVLAGSAVAYYFIRKAGNSAAAFVEYEYEDSADPITIKRD